MGLPGSLHQKVGWEGELAWVQCPKELGAVGQSVCRLLCHAQGRATEAESVLAGGRWAGRARLSRTPTLPLDFHGVSSLHPDAWRLALGSCSHPGDRTAQTSVQLWGRWGGGLSLRPGPWRGGWAGCPRHVKNVSGEA